ncbi:MAG: Gfo/Idh/MocA family oxidoreductase [Tagaea sp.]|nr:Gfo/Idh/MocA family oxidoreductase [Tagaea sp.]
MKTLRVGVIGLGFGAAVHVPGWRTVPGAQIVAIAGSSPERARAAAERLGTENTSVDALLDGDLDAVSIAVPPAAAEPIVARALARGFAVLTEKPLAVDVAAAGRMAALARGRTTAVDFQLPDLATFAAFKAFVDSGAFGKLRHSHLVWLSWSYALANGAASWKLGARDGGALNLFGSHALHMAEWLFGPLRALSARLDDSRTRAVVSEDAAEDTVELAGDFASGARLTALISNAAPGGNSHRWTAVFEGGTATLESSASGHLDGFAFVARDAQGRVVATTEEPKAQGDARIVPFSRLAARFAAAARAGRPATPDFAAGLRVQILMEAARDSHAHGGGAVPADSAA